MVLAVLTAIGFSMAVGTFAVLVQALTSVSVMVGGGLGRYRNLAEARRANAAIAA